MLLKFLIITVTSVDDVGVVVGSMGPRQGQVTVTRKVSLSHSPPGSVTRMVTSV